MIWQRCVPLLRYNEKANKGTLMNKTILSHLALFTVAALYAGKLHHCQRSDAELPRTFWIYLASGIGHGRFIFFIPCFICSRTSRAEGFWHACVMWFIRCRYQYALFFQRIELDNAHQCLFDNVVDPHLSTYSFLWFGEKSYCLGTRLLE